MSTTKPTRILAVEIRAARLGYAVFETPRELRNFGGTWFDSPKVARANIARLFNLYRPSIVVIRGGVMRYPRNMAKRQRIARIVCDEGRKLAISIKRVVSKDFDRFFGSHLCRDKYDVAVTLSQWFPDLARRIPSRPKFYDPEPNSILYFDSIALGIVYMEGLVKSQPEKVVDDRNPFAGLQVT